MNSEYTTEDISKLCEANEWTTLGNLDNGNLEVRLKTSGNIVGQFTPTGWKWKDKYKFVLYKFGDAVVLPEAVEPAPIVDEPAPIVDEPAPIIDEPAPAVEAEPAPTIESEPAPSEEAQ